MNRNHFATSIKRKRATAVKRDVSRQEGENTISLDKLLLPAPEVEMTRGVFLCNARQAFIITLTWIFILSQQFQRHIIVE